MPKADHSGHRARMKKKLAEHGLDVFEPHEVLEILLYYAIPQRNTNDIAKNLIDHFGSLSAVFDASMESLQSAGLTEHQAMLIKLIPGVSRVYLSDKHRNRNKVINSNNIVDYIIDRYIGYEETENVLLLLLDKKGKEVYCGMIAHGDFDSADISFRNIVSLALNYGATAAFLAHSHPSGVALPSPNDVYATLALKDALGLVGVTLVDHFIVADHDCVSLAECGLLDKENVFKSKDKEDGSL
ncbi:MAG: RadC family protein [Ruminococcus sp.]|nr:RadC family protein [Ruminococcus sp.]